MLPQFQLDLPAITVAATPGPDYFGASLGFLGVLVGAAISAGVSYALQRGALKKAARDRDADLREREQATAFSLIIKLIQLHTSFGQILKHLNEEFGRGRAVDVEPWQAVQPLLDDAIPIHIDPSELALLIKYQLNDAYEKAASLSAVHNQAIIILRTYAQRREQLRSMVRHEGFEGRVGTFVMGHAELTATAPLRIEMNDLIRSAYREAEGNFLDAQSALTFAHRGLRDKLGLKFSLDVRQSNSPMPL